MNFPFLAPLRRYASVSQSATDDTNDAGEALDLLYPGTEKRSHPPRRVLSNRNIHVALLYVIIFSLMAFEASRNRWKSSDPVDPSIGIWCT